MYENVGTILLAVKADKDRKFCIYAIFLKLSPASTQKFHSTSKWTYKYSWSISNIEWNDGTFTDFAWSREKFPEQTICHTLFPPKASFRVASEQKIQTAHRFCFDILQQTLRMIFPIFLADSPHSSTSHSFFALISLVEQKLSEFLESADILSFVRAISLHTCNRW